MGTLGPCSEQPGVKPWDQGELVTVSGAQRGRQQGKQRVSKTYSCLLLSHHFVPGELGALGPDTIGCQWASQSYIQSSNSSSCNNSNNVDDDGGDDRVFTATRAVLGALHVLTHSVLIRTKYLFVLSSSILQMKKLRHSGA